MPTKSMPKIKEQDLIVLSSARNGLTFLTSNDWALISDRAVTAQFRNGDSLVAKGKLSNGVYLIVKGQARIRLAAWAKLPALGPGEICGEMSFLEDTPASADVVAIETVEAYHLSAKTLQDLFELFPHLASRFYRSVATNLSRRMRSLIGQTSPVS
jgi:CRP-like cAMP-binding protein